MHEVKVPELAESITEGTISDWMVSEGDSVNEGDVLLELETDKVNVEIHAEQSGVLSNIKKHAGDVVEVGEVIAHIGEGEGKGAPAQDKNEIQEEKKEEQKQPAVSKEEETHADDVTASPAARKLAREKGIDLQRVRPTDPMGRITAEDVKAHTEEPPAAQKAPQKKQPAVQPSPAAESDAGKPVEPGAYVPPSANDCQSFGSGTAQCSDADHVQ